MCVQWGGMSTNFCTWHQSRTYGWKTWYYANWANICLVMSVSTACLLHIKPHSPTPHHHDFINGTGCIAGDRYIPHRWNTWNPSLQADLITTLPQISTAQNTPSWQVCMVARWSNSKHPERIGCTFLQRCGLLPSAQHSPQNQGSMAPRNRAFKWCLAKIMAQLPNVHFFAAT